MTAVYKFCVADMFKFAFFFFYKCLVNFFGKIEKYRE